jgi:hypothetical protein
MFDATTTQRQGLAMVPVRQLTHGETQRRFVDFAGKPALEKMGCLQFYARSDETIIFIVVELPNSRPRILSEASDAVRHLDNSIRMKQKEDPSFNNGYSPPLLIIGHRLPDQFQTDMLQLGARIFDLEQPSNSRFKTGQSLVDHLQSIVQQATLAPRPPRIDNPTVGNSAEIDLSSYYRPLNEGSSLREFLSFINNAED